MLNKYALRAKWSRKSRKFVQPAEKPVLVKREDDVPVSLAQYLLALSYITKCWAHGRAMELEWFLESMRGNLPKRLDTRNWRCVYVFLPHLQYLRALEVLTTKLGVRREDAEPR